MRARLLAGAALFACAASPVMAQSSNANSVAPTGTPQADTPAEPQGPSETPPGAGPQDGVEDIVVTGIRSSLRSSLATKRNAENIVDSITAEDTGKFPDTNIADSLQRITGVAIDRSGGEGQFITVRGLGPEFNTVLVNGRIMATDNPGREFSFDVLSSNLIQRVDVYKTSLPQLQEGGIGATVNVVTARPLDGREGFHATLAAGGIYDSLADKVSPDFSGIVSWTNPDKTFGALLSASYTNRRSQLDSARIGGWILGPQGLIDGTAQSTGLTTAALIDSPSDIHTPREFNFDREEDKRERINVAGSIQGQLTDRLLLTVDGIYSQFNVSQYTRRYGDFFTERFLGVETDANNTVIGFNRPGSDFLAVNPGLLQPLADGSDSRVTRQQNDNIVWTSQRETESYQVGANLAWDVSDQLKLKLDASTTKATQRNPYKFVVVGSLAQTAVRFDLNPQNDLPGLTNLGPITDASLLRAHFAQNDLTRVSDKGSEFHADGEWKADRGILQSLMFGASYNQRRKVRTRADNSDTVCTYCGYDIPIPSNLVQAYSLGNFLPGASGSDALPKDFFTFNQEDIFAFLSDPANLVRPRQGRTAEEQAAEAARVQALAGGPYGRRDRPNARLDVEEKVVAAYLNANFKGDDWSGNVGGRFVSTRLRSAGFGQQIVRIFVNPGDDNLNFIYTDPQAISVRNSYTDFLPSANIKYAITPSMLARAAVSKTVTRPTLTSLGVDNSYGGRLTNATSSGGNPALRPFKSTNYDVSLEYYITDVSYVSVSGFYKAFTDFLESQTLPVTIAGFDFLDTRTRNGQSGSIAGVEVGGQYTFDRLLPGALGGFGVAGNYTYVSSNVERAEGSGTNANNCGYNGLSPHSANGSLFYEKYGLQARASYNWRSSFLRQCFGAASRPENRAAYGQLDMSVSYDVTPVFQVYAQGVNLTNQYVHDYSVIEDRLLMLQNTGSRYLFGVRARF
ncbi:TonB-dependent receptor [Sphingomonas sp. BK580]|uniref:TonB-dependent receptor n=1 Tax=Sphingomonas sp. BK580 TaxID=2586972 RepID=UPI001616E22B|nr:TonB-dependent receptor [Sphingomonas sp. BK580]MBB3694554.1 TonB-dependent receptor [Sphingomonas sp. BK580]